MKRILLVEDERILAMTLRHQLQQKGYNVVEVASTSSEAIEAFQKHGPDVVVMDVCIEGDQDGIATAGILNTLGQVPVVYLTGEDDPQTRQRAQSTAGYSGYLLKPALFAELDVLLIEAMKLNKREFESS
jgi:CheY-like chemotaxis protein